MGVPLSRKSIGVPLEKIYALSNSIFYLWIAFLVMWFILGSDVLQFFFLIGCVRMVAWLWSFSRNKGLTKYSVMIFVKKWFFLLNIFKFCNHASHLVVCGCYILWSSILSDTQICIFRSVSLCLFCVVLLFQN